MLQLQVEQQQPFVSRLLVVSMTTSGIAEYARKNSDFFVNINFGVSSSTSLG